jgi:cytochrome c oxidase cbb3-type subunit IV
MDLVTTIRVGSTVLIFLIFAGIVWWAYGSKRKSRFEDAALSVLEDQDLPGKPCPSGRRA